MKRDRSVIRGRRNIFADLDLPDADEHLLKANVVIFLGAIIKKRGLNQSAAAARMGLKKPDVSKLLRGRFDGFFA